MKMILLFSHKLTDEQIIDAKNILKIEEFIYLPPNLQSIWSNIPPELDSLKEYLKPIKDFVSQFNNNYILIQGDFGAVYEMVNFSKNIGLIPIYATTKREITEIKKDNKIIKQSIFKHIKFRKFE